MSTLTLTLACGDYDRTLPLRRTRKAVETLAGYSFHQSLAPRRRPVEELFSDSLLDT
jgi:hypothetical protein